MTNLSECLSDFSGPREGRDPYYGGRLPNKSKRPPPSKTAYHHHTVVVAVLLRRRLVAVYRPLREFVLLLQVLLAVARNTLMQKLILSLKAGARVKHDKANKAKVIPAFGPYKLAAS